MLAAEKFDAALIAAIATAVAAIIALIGTWWTTRSKLSELRITYGQRLADAHREAARAHQDDLYVPLAAVVGQLDNAFLELRRRPADDDGTNAAVKVFDAAIERFVADVKGLTSEGRDAFLTAQLDTLIREFTDFVIASTSATDVVGRVVYRTSWPLSVNVSAEVTGTAYRFARLLSAIPVSPLGMLVTFAAEDVLAAPLTSPEFEERLQRDVSALKSRIRDITLGAPGVER